MQRLILLLFSLPRQLPGLAQGKLHHCQLLDCSITSHSKNNNRGSRGRDHIVDVFTTTYAISAYHH